MQTFILAFESLEIIFCLSCQGMDVRACMQAQGLDIMDKNHGEYLNQSLVMVVEQRRKNKKNGTFATAHFCV